MRRVLSLYVPSHRRTYWERVVVENEKWGIYKVCEQLSDVWPVKAKREVQL